MSTFYPTRKEGGRRGVVNLQEESRRVKAGGNEQTELETENCRCSVALLSHPIFREKTTKEENNKWMADV